MAQIAAVPHFAERLRLPHDLPAAHLRRALKVNHSGVVNRLKNPMHEPRLRFQRFFGEHLFNDGRLFLFRREIIEHGEQVDVRTGGFDVFVRRQPSSRLHRGLKRPAIAVESFIRDSQAAEHCRNFERAYSRSRNFTTASVRDCTWSFS